MVKDPRPTLLENTAPSEKPILVLMLKQAAPGYGKQRLAREIGQQNALRVAAALLECALEDAASWSGDLAFAVSKECERSWAERFIERIEFDDKEVQILLQCPGNLGTRLRNLDQRLRTNANRKVFLMAGDAPGLLPEHFQQSCAALDNCDIAFVNSSDGGTDLMGSHVGWPEMSDLPWGTTTLGDALAECCEQNSISLERIDGSFDIDTKADLILAATALADDVRPSRRSLLDQIARLNIS